RETEAGVGAPRWIDSSSVTSALTVRGRKLHADEPACRNRVSYAIPRCGRRRGAVPPTSLDLAGSALMHRGTSVAAGGLPDDGSSRGIVARVFARLADVRSSMAGRPDALGGAGHTDGHERGTRP